MIQSHQLQTAPKDEQSKQLLLLVASTELYKIPALLEHKLPEVLVYGDADTVVPYHENGIVLENYYKENGGTILAIGKEGCGHHPHGLEDSTQIIKFIEEHFA